jgi:hypothetical protein
MSSNPPRQGLLRQSGWRKRVSGVRPGVDRLEPREFLTLLGQQLFPSVNAWNQNVAAAPVAANSAAVINHIISLAGGDGRFHPDFGQDTGGSDPLYGIPYDVVHGNTRPKVNVVIGAYASENDIQAAPIPSNAVLEGDNQNGPVAGLANRGDSHLIVYVSVKRTPPRCHEKPLQGDGYGARAPLREADSETGT